MGIKEARQSGNQVNIQNDHHSSMSVQGKLVGFTPKVVYFTNGNFVKLITDDGHGFKGIGVMITLNGGEAVMYGNCVGVKKNGRISLYDENGKPAGSRNA